MEETLKHPDEKGPIRPTAPTTSHPDRGIAGTLPDGRRRGRPEPRRALVLLAMTALAAGPLVAGDLEPTPAAELVYDHEFFPGTSYDPAIPTPQSILGFRPGDRAAFPHEIEQYLQALAAASPRVDLHEYARSHEGRALYRLAVSSAANIADLDSIRTGLARLADPRGLAPSDAERLLDELPATAWMAYSIHGDETSGSDAALAVAHHLAAGTSSEIESLLSGVVVLIDPMQNPDGRHRYLQQIAEGRGKSPNFDDQSLLRGYWPWGRGNHYLFDLNRDWILGVHPETRGRIREAASWHPLLMVDIHEMGSQDTYLFSPARRPINPHLSAAYERWADLFARQQSQAFDRWNWLYYTGEWNEGWYAGYTDSWGGFRGALGILYEQSGYAEDGVRIPGGDVLTYRGAVHRQAVSSLANLETLAANRRSMREGFLAERRAAVAASGPYASRTFAILPTANRSRLAAFLDRMDLQGFETHILDQETSVAGGVDQLGVRFGRRKLPAGTILLANRQPEARLLATMLEFDAPMPDDYLARERRSLLRRGRSSIYDLTAWNLTMFYGLDSLTLESALPAGARRLDRAIDALPEASPAPAPAAEPAVAWIVDGADDASVAYAARLLEQGVALRVADREFEFEGRIFVRGSVVLLPFDNRRSDGDFAALAAATAARLSLTPVAVSTGLGDGDLADIGGRHFRRLEPPRIAVFSRQGVDPNDFGSTWHAIDHRLAIRHSHLDRQGLNFTDLRRYNVLVLPNLWFGDLEEAERESLGSWVEAGGTLIAIAGGAARLTGTDSSLSAVRGLPDVLDRLDEYELALERERRWRAGETPAAAEVWTHTLSATPSYPWQDTSELERPGAEELKRRDDWARLFMPQGVFVAARVDPEHWLTFGTGEELPVLFQRSSRLLMAAGGVETPLRIGVLRPAPGAEAIRIGWSTVPADHELRVRMSGLLWPEAASRLANTALVTREAKGNGQVILFASPPTFRGTTRGAERLLMNALIYGPGFGARAPILP